MRDNLGNSKSAHSTPQARKLGAGKSRHVTTDKYLMQMCKYDGMMLICLLQSLLPPPSLPRYAEHLLHSLVYQEVDRSGSFEPRPGSRFRSPLVPWRSAGQLSRRRNAYHM
jgi:hypothetical protein